MDTEDHTCAEKWETNDRAAQQVSPSGHMSRLGSASAKTTPGTEPNDGREDKTKDWTDEAVEVKESA